MEFVDIAQMLNNFDVELYLTLIISALIYIPLYVLKGIALMKMAKKKNCKNTFLAWIPILSTFYMGEINGKTNFFNKKVKHFGIYASIAEILAVCAGMAFIILIDMVLPYYNFNLQIFQNVPQNLLWITDNYTLLVVLSNVVLIGYYLLKIPVLATLIRDFYPRNYFFMALFSIILPVEGLVLFAIRNNQPIDYEVYVNKMREEYIRRQQTFNNPNFYNQYNPFDNTNNQNTNSNANQNNQTPPDDPFSEFDNKKDKNNSGKG